MSDAFWRQLAAPFLVLVILTLFGIPITLAIRRWMKPGRLKSTLLDRTLVERKPWLGWLAFFSAIGAMFAAGWFGLWLNS